MSKGLGLIVGGVAMAMSGLAKADGYPPFFGYSGYYGAPAPYYTHTPDVHRSTRPVDGDLGFGVATYSTGGPFWGYRRAKMPRELPRGYRTGKVRVRG